MINELRNFNNFEFLAISLIKGPMTGTNINDFYLFYFEK